MLDLGTEVFRNVEELCLQLMVLPYKKNTLFYKESRLGKMLTFGKYR